jgi:membrane protein DedA with SNARE-associated domain
LRHCFVGSIFNYTITQLRNCSITNLMSHSILDLLRNAVVHYGYWAVGVALLLENAGVPVPGETILLLASFLAFSEHELQLPWIILVATIAATLGDNLGFALGYYGGRPLLVRYQSIFRIQDKTLTQGENLFARYGPVTVFFARFVFGMRIIAGPMAGVLRMPWRKFLVYNFLGAAVWVTVISAAGYLFGQHWMRLERNLKRLDVAVAIVVLLLAAYWLWRSRRNS